MQLSIIQIIQTITISDNMPKYHYLSRKSSNHVIISFLSFIIMMLVNFFIKNGSSYFSFLIFPFLFPCLLIWYFVSLYVWLLALFISCLCVCMAVILLLALLLTHLPLIYLLIIFTFVSYLLILLIVCFAMLLDWTLYCLHSCVLDCRCISPCMLIAPCMVTYLFSFVLTHLLSLLLLIWFSFLSDNWLHLYWLHWIICQKSTDNIIYIHFTDMIYIHFTFNWVAYY